MILEGTTNDNADILRACWRKSIPYQPNKSKSIEANQMNINILIYTVQLGLILVSSTKLTLRTKN